jgi:hypothetical protein
MPRPNSDPHLVRRAQVLLNVAQCIEALVNHPRFAKKDEEYRKLLKKNTGKDVERG